MRLSLKGIKAVTDAFEGTPEQLRRSARNTVNRGLTRARRDAVNDINSDLRIPKKTIRDRLPITRTARDNLRGLISSDNKPLAITLYKPKIRRISNTQASISVKDELRGSIRTSVSGFMNPRHSRKRALRRVKGAKRYPISLPKGPSVAVQFEALMNKVPAYKQGVTRFMLQELQRQLADQLKK